MTNTCCVSKAKNAVLITNIGRNTIDTIQKRTTPWVCARERMQQRSPFPSLLQWEEKKIKAVKIQIVPLGPSGQENKCQNERAKAKMPYYSPAFKGKLWSCARCGELRGQSGVPISEAWHAASLLCSEQALDLCPAQPIATLRTRNRTVQVSQYPPLICSCPQRDSRIHKHKQSQDSPFGSSARFPPGQSLV